MPVPVQTTIHVKADSRGDIADYLHQAGRREFELYRSPFNSLSRRDRLRLSILSSVPLDQHTDLIKESLLV